MTPEEFAEQTGLTVEEAAIILERRSIPKLSPGGRLAQALETLSDACKKTGVAPVTVKADGRLEKSELQDPEALEKFYANKGLARMARDAVKPSHEEVEDMMRPMGTRSRFAVRRTDEDQSQDPEDWK